MKVVDKSKNKNLKKEAASKNGKKDDGNNQDGCCIPMIECIKREDPLPQSPADGIKFDCSNSDCQFSKQYAHPECFEKLEEDLLILLRSHGGARGWSEEKLMLAFKKVWRRKGSTFLQSSIKCKCGKGIMMRDEEAWEKREAIVEPEPEKKEKKKNKTKVLPELQHKIVPIPKLDNHYLSSRSPPPSISSLDDKYGPIIKAPKRTRKETDTSMTSTDTNLAKRHVPIGFAPIEPKPVIQKQKSEEPSPKIDPPVELNPPEQPFKLIEPVKAWQKVDHKHVGPYSVNHTVEVEKMEPRRVEIEIRNHQEKLKAEELVKKKKENPWNHVDEIKRSFKITDTTSNSKFVSTAVQTDETCFPNQYSLKPYQSRNIMAVQTDEAPPPEAIFNPFDSGINSTACSPKIFAESFQQKPNFGNSNCSVPPGFSSDHLKSLSIKEKSEFKNSNFDPKPQHYLPAYSPPTVNFLFKDNYFAVEINQNGRREYIRNNYNKEWTPMYLSMLGKPPVIGEMAQSHCSHFPKRVIYDVLKIFGKSMNEIQINSNWGFKLVNQNGIIYFEIESLEGLLSQEMVLAIFFKTMKAQAESHLNTTVQEINVLTDFKLSESQKLIFNCAAAKLNFEIIRFHFSL